MSSFHIFFVAILNVFALKIHHSRVQTQTINCDNQPTEADQKICKQLYAWTRNNRENPINLRLTCDECVNCLPRTNTTMSWPTEDCKIRCWKLEKDACFDLAGLPAVPCVGEKEHMCFEKGVIAPTPRGGCPDHIHECMDINCLQAYDFNINHGDMLDCFKNLEDYRSHLTMRTAIRKEYRVLNDMERRSFHEVIQSLKKKHTFDLFAGTHGDFAVGGSAHAGPGFLPWHREFLKRFEFEMRLEAVRLNIATEIGIPYWDTTLDDHLPDPRDSVLWTEELLGGIDASGNVHNGPFSLFDAINWTTLQTKEISHTDWRDEYRGKLYEFQIDAEGNWRKPYSLTESNNIITMPTNQHVKREIGKTQGSGMLTDSDIDWFLSQTRIEAILGNSIPTGSPCPFIPDRRLIEWTHGKVHQFVGGDMSEQTTTANDPTFYLLHSFVDMIWEIWRQIHQNRWQRESIYPAYINNCSTPDHGYNMNMYPFRNWNNIGGLSNEYTDYLYNYQDRPTCSEWLPDCGSKFLFCDRSHGTSRCTSKVKMNGNCQGFDSTDDVCYKGVCVNGRCREHSTNCFNSHICCAGWAAQGHCTMYPDFMRTQCPASCSNCVPDYNMAIECANRSPNCDAMARSGNCFNFDHRPWMNENCRQSCNQCQQSRQELCQQSGCVNFHYECVQWANISTCSHQNGFMGVHCCAACQQIFNFNS